MNERNAFSVMPRRTPVRCASAPVGDALRAARWLPQVTDDPHHEEDSA